MTGGKGERKGRGVTGNACNVVTLSQLLGMILVLLICGRVSSTAAPLSTRQRAAHHKKWTPEQ